MFNIGPGELIIVALVLLIAVGPEQLPGVVRRVGSAIGQAKSMTDGLRSEFMSGLDEIERATDPNAWAASSGPSNVKPRSAPEPDEPADDTVTDDTAADVAATDSAANRYGEATNSAESNGDQSPATAERNGTSGPDRTPFSAPGTYQNEAPIRDASTSRAGQPDVANGEVAASDEPSPDVPVAELVDHAGPETASAEDGPSPGGEVEAEAEHRLEDETEARHQAGPGPGSGVEPGEAPA